VLSLSVTVGHWDIFLLVLVRVAAMVMVAPVLGGRPVPAQVKIGLSLLLIGMVAFGIWMGWLQPHGVGQ